MITAMMEKARAAQRVFEAYTQEQVDACVRAIGKVVYDNAEMLAKMAVEETGMGVYEDKVAKNKGKSRIIWNHLKGKKSVGIIEHDEKNALYLVAKPKGVVASVTPTTNPCVTPMANSMQALKGRNAIIVAPHPRSKNTSAKTVELMNAELAKLGAPENLIQIITQPSIELTAELMKAADAVVATGGMAMVKSAYSSGKPAYGVGAGNVQVIIDRDCDMAKAAEMVIAGRKFDNGIICSGEQSVITPCELFSDMMLAMRQAGAFYVEDAETVEKFAEAIFPGQGAINPKVVGQSPQFVGQLAGVDVPADAKVILLKARGVGRADPLCKEKLCPVMVALAYDSFEQAVEIAQANLDFEGRGHSCAIHSNNLAHIQYAGDKLTISRLVVNQVSSTSAGGSFFNGFAPTTTLGCGSWGNNSISENFDYIHLINISRIGMYNDKATQPTDEEIWG